MSLFCWGGILIAFIHIFNVFGNSCLEIYFYVKYVLVERCLFQLLTVRRIIFCRTVMFAVRFAFFVCM